MAASATPAKVETIGGDRTRDKNNLAPGGRQNAGNYLLTGNEQLR